MSPPSLSESGRCKLDAPLTVEEIELAIAQRPSHKTPGLDGLPTEYYSKFRHLLSPHLLRTFNTALKEGILPPSMWKALIVLILKTYKDPLDCDSYWPMSLNNVDVKILANVLDNRFNRVDPSLVQSDQGGFMPCHSRMNIRRLFQNLQYPHDHSTTHVIVSLDTCKAFDSVEWPYLFKILQLYEFGSRMIAWVRLFYSSPGQGPR